MKALFTWLIYLSLFVAFMASGLFAMGYRDFTGPGPLAETRIVAIEKGSGVGAIANRLSEERVIGQPLLFRFAARISGDHTRLHAGEYEFPAHVAMNEVLRMMAAGEVYHRRITIPEGLTSWQIVQLLNRTPELTGEITDIPKEGTLLPETYDYMKGDDRQAKLDEMREAMKRTLRELEQNKPADAPLLSEGEAVILASIIEKETAIASERRRISGVFHNRLKLGMKLQTDPTVIYAITGGKIDEGGKGPLGRRLLSKDLQFESPYNTYKYPGLPPGPIANPGRASLEAAIDPEKNNFLYFVADGAGGHVFSQTLEEHNANVTKWRRIRREQGN